MSPGTDYITMITFSSWLLFCYQAALAAKRARELVRQKSVLKSSSLPGKLADCSSTNPEESGKCCFTSFKNYLIYRVGEHFDHHEVFMGIFL